MPTAAAGLVSVLVPTFDGARYLAAALESVAAQTYDRLEIVVSDDGSSDGTLPIAREWADRDGRVRVHPADERLGPVGNFARCLQLASGETVKFLMQDDVLAPDAIERLREALLADDRIVLATSRRVRIDESGGPLPDRPEVAPLYDVDTVVDGRVLGDLVLERNLNQIGEPSTVLFRRRALAGAEPFSLGGPRYRYLADVALWLTLLEHGRAAYLAEPLSCSRAHPDQDSARRSNLVVSVLEWERMHREAKALGYLSAPDAQRRARDRWLSNAPFFYRFCTGPRQAWDLTRRIVATDLAGVRAGQRTRSRAAGSTARAVATAPVAGLLATPVHRVRHGR